MRCFLEDLVLGLSKGKFCFTDRINLQKTNSER